MMENLFKFIRFPKHTYKNSPGPSAVGSFLFPRSLFPFFRLYKNLYKKERIFTFSARKIRA